MTKRSFNKRQMTIISFIRDKKLQKAKIVTLDEIQELCIAEGLLPKVSPASERATIIATMNVLVKSLNSSGIYIEKANKIGRSMKCEFMI